MDLIGSITYIENRLGGRKPNQGKGKSAHKDSRDNAVTELENQADTQHASTEYDARLGRKIDITA